MKNREIAVVDIVAEAIKHAIKNDIFDENFVKKIRDEGAKMTVQFASKFYQVHYAVYLQQSANIVRGICTLGATLIGDVSQVAIFLKEKGFVGLFQKGFVAVRELSEKTQLFDEFDSSYGMSIKDVAELVMFEDGIDWQGFANYMETLEKASQRERFVNFQKFFARKHRFNFQGDMDFDKKIFTILFSSIPSSSIIKYTSKMSLIDIMRIISIIEQNGGVAYALKRLEEFVDNQAISDDYRKSLSAYVLDLIKHIEDFLKKRDVEFFTSFLNTEEDVDSLITLEENDFFEETLNTDEVLDMIKRR